jgi:hypothetical protein
MKIPTFILSLILFSTFTAFTQEKYSDYTQKQKTKIFLDDFSDNSNNWWTGDNPYAYGAIEQGTYIMEWRGSLPIWNSYKEIKFDLNKDFEIEAQIKQISGSPDFLFGLVFNRSEKGEYGFIVNQQNGSVVYQDKTDEDRRFLKSGTDNSIVINVEAYKNNKFTIRKIKNEFYFFINEQYVGSGFVDDLNSNLIGFQLWYKIKIAVDNLTVSYLNSMNYPPEITITSPEVSRGFIPVESKKQITITGNVSTDCGILEVLVNNQEAFVDASGNFSKTVNLAFGENSFTVKATDINNLSSIQVFTIKRLSEQEGNVTVNNNPENLSTGKYYALIIGVSNYTDTKIPGLDNEPLKDAENLFNILSTRYIFEKDNVKLLKDPSYKQIIRTFDDLSKTITEADNLLIFYAGHGYYDDKKEIGYWLPSDAEHEYTDAWLYNSVLVDNIKKINSKHTLLISDACFSGSIFKTRALPNITEKAYQKKYELKSRNAITSGILKTVPNKSIFFKYLSEKLANNTQTYLSASELFQQIEIPVGNNSPNVPQFGNIQNVGDEGGDFIFIKK